MKSSKRINEGRPSMWGRVCRSLTVLLFMCLLVSHHSYSQESRTSKPNPMAREDVQRGMAQFKQSCAMCHGTEAKGGTGPDLIESSLVRHDQNGNLIGDVIHNGRLDKGMPSFPSFTSSQISDLVAFLHATVTASDNRSSGGPARGYALKPLLTGSAAAGKEFFNGPGKCTSCHSPTGDLKGIAKKYSPRELEGQLLYPSVKTRTALITLPSGEKVKGEVLHLDDFYASLIDSKGEYRSFPLEEGVKVEVEDPLYTHRELLERYTDKEIHDVFAYLETLQ